MEVPSKFANVTSRRGEQGHSLIELLIVVSVIAILTAMTIFSLTANKAAYKTDDQALKILDFVREANSRSLTYRETTRLEIDTTDNKIRIIDENSNTTTTDDKEIRSMPLEKIADVVVDRAPTGVTVPNPPNYTGAVYAVDTIGHLEGTTTVNGHRVWAIRFRSDGTVVNGANTVTSSTLWVFPPLSAATLDTPKSKPQVRAITIFGGSAGVKLWKYDGTTWNAG
jgi:prepilin-type N-terminal cleavage/methylation domain-containing protein